MVELYIDDLVKDGASISDFADTTALQDFITGSKLDVLESTDCSLVSPIIKVEYTSQKEGTSSTAYTVSNNLFLEVDSKDIKLSKFGVNLASGGFQETVNASLTDVAGTTLDV